MKTRRAIWWVGNGLLFLAVLPLLVLLLSRLLTPLREIRDYLADARQFSDSAARRLAAVEGLTTTRDLVMDIRARLDGHQSVPAARS